MRLDSGNFTIRKQTWSVEYPDRFYPTIDVAWQGRQLEAERAPEIAEGIFGPDGCPIPSRPSRANETGESRDDPPRSGTIGDGATADAEGATHPMTGSRRGVPPAGSAAPAAEREVSRQPPYAVDAVCFDLLTALLDSWSVWEAVATEVGAPGRGRVWREAALRLVTAAGDYRPYEALVAEAARATGVGPDGARVLSDRWGGLRPWPEVPGVLAGLSLPLATATNCPEALARSGVTALGVPFAVVVSAERAGAYKPDPRPYRLALSDLGLPPERVLFVAGSAHDVGGALRVGMPTVWVNRLDHPVPPDAADAVVVPDLTGLPSLIDPGGPPAGEPTRNRNVSSTRGRPM